MFLIEKSSCFDKWLRKLKDRIAVARILVRIKKVENGNLGEYRSVGGRVSELKIDYGPGYRLIGYQGRISTLDIEVLMAHV